MSRDDVARLDRALAGVRYPADKWQLIAHATERDRIKRGLVDERMIRQLWALPAGRYPGLADVLTAAARTARGHPRRDSPHQITG
ncbi:DUF2795 domain-containing protein [Pseudonocardia acidicola]|uniref:DUF2795 domain-containing protein n=1 Tax=Pseudonocardia acidicola TaxID=2724939 RepID=A0ABX1S3K3_9PSEU|nr:DUF2795 domain-containing protein [Pseudonocardia acidicola]NMH96160.1 DUF2795 domain-containing protein [Pseudonocardia acidicola]